MRKLDLKYGFAHIFIFSFLFIIAAEVVVWWRSQGELFKGYYFQTWTGDDMMQTIPVQYLHDAPFHAIFYTHIQPPMLDVVRSILAAFSPYPSGVALEHFVDYGTYLIWAMLFAVLAAMVYRWVLDATGSQATALVAFLIWLLHPGGFYVATLLEGTLLSTLLTTWLLREVWNFSRGGGSSRRVTLAAALAFYTRTAFQWYFLPVLLVALALAGASRRQLLVVGLSVATVMAPLLIKQKILFGSVSTTSYAGAHKLGVIWYYPTDEEIPRYRAQIEYSYPPEANQYTGHFNAEGEVIQNLVFEKIFQDRMKCCAAEAFANVAKSIWQNVSNFWRPTSRFTPNVLVDSLPWREVYDKAFNENFIIPLSLALGFWFWRQQRLRWQGWRFAGPVLLASYVLAVTLLGNRYEWIEAQRLKFFLEPSAFVFVTVQAVAAWRLWAARRRPDTG